MLVVASDVGNLWLSTGGGLYPTSIDLLVERLLEGFLPPWKPLVSAGFGRELKKSAYDYAWIGAYFAYDYAWIGAYFAYDYAWIKFLVHI